MAKNRNKKKKLNDGVASMDISLDAPQAMDTSEGKPMKASQGDITRKLKKGVQMKRSKNLRRQKAVAKAVTIGEKSEEKVSRSKNKTQRIQSAKSLYD